MFLLTTGFQQAAVIQAVALLYFCRLRTPTTSFHYLCFLREALGTVQREHWAQTAGTQIAGSSFAPVQIGGMGKHARHRVLGNCEQQWLYQTGLHSLAFCPGLLCPMPRERRCAVITVEAGAVGWPSLSNLMVRIMLASQNQFLWSIKSIHHFPHMLWNHLNNVEMTCSSCLKELKLKLYIWCLF